MALPINHTPAPDAEARIEEMLGLSHKPGAIAGIERDGIRIDRYGNETNATIRITYVGTVDVAVAERIVALLGGA